MSVRPDLARYTPHRQARDATLDGVTVPGLHGDYFRRTDGSRIATVGVYRYEGVELFMAWGYADEEHCSHHAVRRPDGTWSEPAIGCPRLRFAPDGVAGVRIDPDLSVLISGVIVAP